MVFRGGGGRGGGGAGGRADGQAGQMEDGTQQLGHCMVDMKELSANPEGLTAAGELTALCCLSVCLSLNLSPPALSCVLPHTVKLCDTSSAIDSVSYTVSYCFYKCVSQ